jgi:hypothetical protein
MKPTCKTCNDTGFVTVCIDEHGMQDTMPCGDCPPKVSKLVVDRWRRSEVVSAPEPKIVVEGKLNCTCGSVHVDLDQFQGESVDGGARPDSLQAVLCRVSQLLHGWHQDGTSWSEWDESVYREVCHWQRHIDGKVVTVGDADPTEALRELVEATRYGKGSGQCVVDARNKAEVLLNGGATDGGARELQPELGNLFDRWDMMMNDTKGFLREQDENFCRAIEALRAAVDRRKR